MFNSTSKIDHNSNKKEQSHEVSGEARIKRQQACCTQKPNTSLFPYKQRQRTQLFAPLCLRRKTFTPAPIQEQL